jgi:hypothetical protein
MADINLGWDVEGILTPKESVEAMLRVIATKTPEQTGTFWTWDGRVSHPSPSFPSLNSFIYSFILPLPPSPLSPSPHPLRSSKEIERAKKEKRADYGRLRLLYHTGASMVMTTMCVYRPTVLPPSHQKTTFGMRRLWLWLLQRQNAGETS